MSPTTTRMFDDNKNGENINAKNPKIMTRRVSLKFFDAFGGGPTTSEYNAYPAAPHQSNTFQMRVSVPSSINSMDAPLQSGERNSG